MQRIITLVSVTILALLGILGSSCTAEPIAEFEVDISSGQAPLTVTFTNKSSNADEFEWDFGDGTTTTSNAEDEPVVYEYVKAGTHTVTLTAIKQDEPVMTNTMTLSITVNPDILEKVTVIPIEVACSLIIKSKDMTSA